MRLLKFGSDAMTACKRMLATSIARNSGEFNRTVQFGPQGRIDNILGWRHAVRVGAHSFVDGQLLTFGHGGEIQIGDWCYVGTGSRIWSAARITIGNRVLISHGVEIHDTNSHTMDAAARFEQTKAILTTGHPRQIEGIAASPIQIGDDVWIGFGAAIFRGVTIGARAVIGARAIVREDVPPDAVVRPWTPSESGTAQ